MVATQSLWDWPGYLSDRVMLVPATQLPRPVSRAASYLMLGPKPSGWMVTSFSMMLVRGMPARNIDSRYGVRITLDNFEAKEEDTLAGNVRHDMHYRYNVTVHQRQGDIEDEVYILVETPGYRGGIAEYPVDSTRPGEISDMTAFLMGSAFGLGLRLSKGSW